MRILIVNPYYYPNSIGGTESVVQNLAEGLVKKGHAVAVFTADGRDKTVQSENINGVEIYRGIKGKYVVKPSGKNNPINIKIRNNIRNRCNLFIKKEFDYVCDKFAPDIVHTQNLPGMSSRIWLYANLREIPIVHTLHDYWILDNKIQPWFKKYSKLPQIVTAPSDFVLKKFEKDRYFENGIYCVVKNGTNVDLKKLNERLQERQYRRNTSLVKFLYAGQLAKIKGVDLLMDIFQNWKNKNVQLLICGHGELESKVTMAEKQDSRIHFLGKLSKNELEKIYDQADILVVPSIWDEPFGMVAIEAYAKGLVVIAGNRGGLIDIVSTIGVGMLVNPTDKEEFKNAMIRYSDRNVIKKEILNIPNNVGLFSIENQVDQFENIYRKLIE